MHFCIDMANFRVLYSGRLRTYWAQRHLNRRGMFHMGRIKNVDKIIPIGKLMETDYNYLAE